MQVIDKKSYLVYPVYNNSAATFTASLTKREQLSPVDIKVGGIVLPGVHFNVLTVWQMDEGIKLAADRIVQYFDTADEMWAYLVDTMKFDKKTLTQNTLHFLPYNASYLENWLNSNGLKDNWDAMGLIPPQYYPAQNIGLKTWQRIGKNSENMVVGGVLGLANKPIEKATKLWGNDFYYFGQVGDTPGPTDIIATDYHRAWAPIVCTGFLGSSSYEVGCEYQGVSWNPGSYINRRRGIMIPVLYRAPLPDSSDPDNEQYYGILSYGYNWDGSVGKYFVYVDNYSLTPLSSGNLMIYSGPSNADTLNCTSVIDLFFASAVPYSPLPPDPYEDIAESETGGGEGTLDWTSDEVEDDTANIYTPFIADDATAGNTPLYNVYHMGINPSISLAQLHTYMWTDSNFLDAITKSNADIRQSIISLHALPYVCTFDSSSSPEIILCGHGSGVHALGGVPQKEDFDLGSIEVKEFYGSYLDYSPFTSVSIYLPFIGTRDLPVDRVMGKTVSLKYTFDNYTGNCVARVFADGNLIDCYNGQCSLTYPITGADYSQKLMGTIMTVGGIAAVAGGLLSMGGSLAAGAAIGKVATAGALSGGAKMLAGGAASAMLGSASAEKASVYHNGNLGGSTSWYAHRTPFLTITSPRLAHPTGKLTLAGGRVVRTETVGDLSGYTQFDIIHIDQVACSDEERTLIEEIMTSGVIL